MTCRKGNAGGRCSGRCAGLVRLRYSRACSRISLRSARVGTAFHNAWMLEEAREYVRLNELGTLDEEQEEGDALE